MLWSGDDGQSFSKHVDMISARSQLNELQMKLESVETQRKRARIEYDRDIDNIRKERQVIFYVRTFVETCVNSLITLHYIAIILSVLTARTTGEKMNHKQFTEYNIQTDDRQTDNIL